MTYVPFGPPPYGPPFYPTYPPYYAPEPAQPQKSGWVCPKCDRSYAPWFKGPCEHESPPKIGNTTRTIDSLEIRTMGGESWFIDIDEEE